MIMRWPSLRLSVTAMSLAVCLPGLFGAALAQSAIGAPPSPEGKCSDIDFMEGTWDVRDVNGTLDAVLRIKLDAGHCSSMESWQFTPVFGGKHVTCMMVYASGPRDWARLCTGFANGDRYRSSGGKRVGQELRLVHDTNAMTDGVVGSIVLVDLPDGRIQEVVRESVDGGANWRITDETYYSRHK